MLSTATFERRRHSRYGIRLRADLTISDSSSETMCTATNMSRYGIRLESSVDIPVGLCGIRLYLQSSEAQPVIGRVNLVRHETTPTGNNIYGGALSFSISSESSRRKVQAFLKSLGSKSLDERRRSDRRQTSIDVPRERRAKGRRREFGIFTESALFANRVDGWKSKYTLFRRCESSNAARIVVNGRELIWFGSTDYFGLSHDSRVIEAAKVALDRYGTKPGYRALNGTIALHEELEHELADYKGTESALMFSGGYLGNVAILTALLKEDDMVFIDEMAHSSLSDGCRFSGAKVIPFRHNVVNDLIAKIKRNRNSRSLIIVDGVYSVDGDLAPLPLIHEVALKENIPLLVDDAHGFGVMGKTGAGTVEHFGLTGEVDLDVGTMSKSLGGSGGFLACRRYIKDYLQHASKGFTFTVNLPPPTIAGVLETLRILKRSSQLRQKLWRNARILKDGLKELGYTLSPSESAVMSIPIGHEHVTFALVRMLEERGVCVGPVFRPMVRKGGGRLRFSVTSVHSEEDIAFALKIMKELKPKADEMIRKEGIVN